METPGWGQILGDMWGLKIGDQKAGKVGAGVGGLESS